MRCELEAAETRRQQESGMWLRATTRKEEEVRVVVDRSGSHRDRLEVAVVFPVTIRHERRTVNLLDLYAEVLLQIERPSVVMTHVYVLPVFVAHHVDAVGNSQCQFLRSGVWMILRTYVAPLLRANSANA